jgi:hypothetical protein
MLFGFFLNRNYNYPIPSEQPFVGKYFRESLSGEESEPTLDILKIPMIICRLPGFSIIF